MVVFVLKPKIITKNVLSGKQQTSGFSSLRRYLDDQIYMYLYGTIELLC